MRARTLSVLAVALCAVVSACARAPAPLLQNRPAFSVHPLTSASPLVAVHSGSVQALVPKTWDAQPLPVTRFAQEGFMASPRLPDWRERAGSVNGMEAFWVDEGKVGIPTDLYYLVARGPSFGFLDLGKSCRPAKHRVFVDHPPDLTGRSFSPSDYVASASGVCRTEMGATRWAYVVAAPGFGPLRSVAIPTSGLYVVIAAVSGSQSEGLLDQMMNGARFANTSIPQIEAAAMKAR